MFMEYRISSNKDAIISDLTAIAVDAYQYSQRPESMGGGDGSYDGYAIPVSVRSNDNATYALGSGGASGPGAFQGSSRSHRHGNGQGRGHNSGSIPGQGSSTSGGVLTIVGVSSLGYGTVTMVINDSSRVPEVTFSGKFE